MTFEECERVYALLYAEFADRARFILAKAIDASPSLPGMRFIQARAKSPDRLRRRLEEVGKLDTDQLEQDRKDLAGVRLIKTTLDEEFDFLVLIEIEIFVRTPILMG